MPPMSSTLDEFSCCFCHIWTLYGPLWLPKFDVLSLVTIMCYFFFECFFVLLPLIILPMSSFHAIVVTSTSRINHIKQTSTQKIIYSIMFHANFQIMSLKITWERKGKLLGTGCTIKRQGLNVEHGKF